MVEGCASALSCAGVDHRSGKTGHRVLLTFDDLKAPPGAGVLEQAPYYQRGSKAWDYFPDSVRHEMDSAGGFSRFQLGNSPSPVLLPFLENKPTVPSRLADPTGPGNEPAAAGRKRLQRLHYGTTVAPLHLALKGNRTGPGEVTLVPVPFKTEEIAVPLYTGQTPPQRRCGASGCGWTRALAR